MTDKSAPTPPPHFTTTRPVAVLMAFTAAVVFGFFSYNLLPLTLMPELSYPTVTVRTEYPGSAPEEVENDISRPLEEALGVIGGLERISSVSRAGVSDVVLEFAWDTDMGEATQDALEKLDLVFLPDEAKRPRILHYDPSLDPVMELSLSSSDERFAGEEGLRRLRRIAELQIKRALEPIKGVAAVRIKGGLEEEIHILLNEEDLRRTGISIQAVIARLGQENINVAGGTLTEGRTEYTVRTLNEYKSLTEIEETVVASFGGRDVRIKDLGRIERGHKDREILTRTDGGESVQIEVFKEADANIVALAGRVKAKIGELPEEPTDESEEKAEEEKDDDGKASRRKSMALAEFLFENEGVELKVVADRSLFIESSINEVRRTAIIGGLLAVTVLFLFLSNIRTTLIIAVSIPLSILITFAPMHSLGVTLNIMSLGGLALGIGMLVDSSIVVLESIFRCREEGDSIPAAATRGTSEVRGAVVASTLTTIAVFFPMVFVEGIAGQAFGDLGAAVVISLIAALAVALFFIPMLASRQGLTTTGSKLSAKEFRKFAAWAALRDSLSTGPTWRRALGFPYFLVRFILGSVLELIAKTVVGLFVALLGLGGLLHRVGKVVLGVPLRLPLAFARGILRGSEKVYPPVIRWALRNPLTIAVLMVVTVAATAQLAQELGSELIPEVHQGEFTIEVSLPVGTPLTETERILSPIEKAILAERESIDALILTIGYDAANMSRSDEGEHTARFKVLLDSEHRDPETEERVIQRLRKRLKEVPDLAVRVTRPVLFSSRTPIEVEVHGNDLFMLRDQSEKVAEVMSGMRELTDVETSLKDGAPEVQIVYDRDLLARYDLNISDVATLVRDKVKGTEATRFNRQDRRIPIIVRLSEEDRETVSEIRDITINPGAERPIPLAAVAEVSLGEGPSEVRRVDRRRIALVNANLGDASLGAASATIDRILRSDVTWPSSMTFFLAGQNQEWERSKRSLLLALGLSVFLVYVIMAAQFESLTQPFVIMFTIPLAFFGTVVALWALKINLSIVVFLGMIMLAGIVVNNAIVLVDYINTLRSRGMPRDQAIVQAGSVRLRPILMTTATTVLGLLPMALGFGDGAEIRTPMAVAVISGLLVSTVLTLLVIPTTYSMVERARDLFFAPQTADDEELPATPNAPAERMAT